MEKKSLQKIKKIFLKSQRKKAVFNKSKNEFKTNPFAIYLEENKEKICKPSKHNNGPEITSMKYVDSKLGNHIDITHKNASAKNKKVILLQISPYRTDFYYSKDKGYKFVTVRYKDVFYSKTKECYVYNI